MGLKLVIVDDAPFIREAIRGAVERSEFDLIGEAANGIEAVELVCRLKPDLVLMDLVMPEKNGVEATREIMTQVPNTKIIACSTLSEKKYILQALEAGCCSFIEKPFDKSDLLEKLRKAGSA